MLSNDVRNTVRIFNKDRFRIGMAGDSLSDTDSMLERGIIDSTGVVVSFVARKLGVGA